MASRRSGRLASTAQPVELDISASAADSVVPPTKTKQQLSSNSEAEKENMINKAIPVAKRTGRPRKQQALQEEVAAGGPAPVTAAAEGLVVEVKATKKVSKKKVALVLPEEGGADDVNEKGAVLAKKEAKGVTKEEVDSVIEDLKSVGISLQSRPTRKTAVRVNYKVLNETGAREAM